MYAFVAFGPNGIDVTDIGAEIQRTINTGDGVQVTEVTHSLDDFNTPAGLYIAFHLPRDSLTSHPGKPFQAARISPQVF
jgi:hypothetical protein